MQKRLVRVGHSLALVIDKPWLSVLNINQTSRLAIGCDGRRLVVEPLHGDSDPRTPTAREALKVYRELQQLGLTQELFDELAPVSMRLGSYVATLDSGRDPSHEVAITMRRMSELRQRLRYGWSKREAIAAAVAAVPFLLPTGIETRLDDGGQAPLRPLLDVLLGDDRDDRRDQHEPDEEDEEPSTVPVVIDLLPDDA